MRQNLPAEGCRVAACGPCDDLGTALEAHLGQDARHVVLDGLLGDAELVADFPVRKALTNEFNHAAFHGREPAEHFVVAHTDVLAVFLAGRGQTNGLDDLLGASGLGKEHVGASGACGGARLVVVITREHHDVGVWQRAAHVSDELKSGAVGEAKVRENDVGADGIGAAHCLRYGASLGDDLDAIGAVQNVADATAYYLVVIQHQNPDVVHGNRLTRGPGFTRGQGPGSHDEFRAQTDLLDVASRSHVRWS
jgi:hypothetical protein